jgi:hypothetical protein
MSDPFDESPTGSADAPGAAEAPAEAAVSPAAKRFDTCRWRKAAEDGSPAHCTHRDVVTMAGTQAFSPEAWCTDCDKFKVRRTPRKPTPQPTYDRYY